MPSSVIVPDAGVAPMDREVTVALDGTAFYTGDLVPTIWWLILVASSLLNLVLLAIRLASNFRSRDPYARKMTYCSAMFIVGCAVRSIWPRVDVERICFWDSWISFTFVGRCLATCAEICFGAQFSLTLGVLAQSVKYHRTKRFADAIFWAICMAQCCCWMGVTTRRQIWHAVEESIWAATFTGVAVAVANIYRALPKSDNCLGILEPGELGYTKRFLFFAFPGSIAYVLFMVLVDVPMYVHRFQADQARGASYLWVSQGILDTMKCSVVSKSLSDWEPEIPWMTGYFVGATALSLWLSWGPRFSDKTD